MFDYGLMPFVIPGLTRNPSAMEVDSESSSE